MPSLEKDWSGSGVTQAFRRHAYVRIYINGGGRYDDVTDVMNPFLISVEAISKWGDTSECHIELDDRDAKLAIPAADAGIVIVFGWQGEGPRINPPPAMIPGVKPSKPQSHNRGSRQELPWEQTGMVPVFTGQVSDCESGFSRRGGGRRLWIDGKAFNLFGNGKTPQTQSQGEGEPPAGGAAGGAGGAGGGDASGPPGGMTMIPFSEVAQKFGQAAGYNVQVAPMLAKVTRPFWSMQNESFHNWFSRISEEVGATPNFEQDQAAALVPGFTADGQAVAEHEAVWGSNLISWRIKPYAGRPIYSGASSNYYDVAKGLHQVVKSAISGAGGLDVASQATGGLPNSAPNQQIGQQFNDGVEAHSLGNRGTGWAIINGEPAVVGGHKLRIRGARPGVDGVYLIREAAHLYSRSGGYTTRCKLENPVIGDTGQVD